MSATLPPCPPEVGITIRVRGCGTCPLEKRSGTLRYCRATDDGRLRHQLGQCGSAAADGQHAGALPCEFESRGTPDPAGRTGNDDGLAGEG